MEAGSRRTTSVAFGAMEPPAQVDPEHRRLRYSRAFALAGFAPADAQRWRESGWVDARQAAEWRHLEACCTPAILRSLAEDGFHPAQVEWVVRFAPGLDEDQIRARLRTGPALPDLDIDLRDRVLQNLRRPYGAASAALSRPARRAP